MTRLDQRSNRRRRRPRLFLVGAPAAARRALGARWTGVVCPVGVEPDDLAAALPAPRLDDAILVWVGTPSPHDAARIGALHAAHPRLPLLVRLPRGRATEAVRALGAGAHEIVRTPADLPSAIARARARAGLLVGNGRRRARQPASAYEGLFPNLYDWIYVVGVAEDGQMSFETINPPLHAASDFLNPDFAGRTPAECLPPPSAAVVTAHLDQVHAEGRPLQFDEQHVVGGHVRSFQTILTPIRNKWGRIHRIAGISRDTTALTETQAALRASEERLSYALEGTQQSLWDWDLRRGVVYRSPRFFEMLGLRPGDVAETIEAGLALVHPDDRAGVEQAIGLHVDGHLPRFQAEYRVRTAAGEWLWLFDAGKVVEWTADGQAARLAGLCTDITERRRAEESLRALVGGVVHEMRNPAFGIGVNLDALEATFGDDPRTRPFVGALRESCNRILSLMNDLRDYGEPRTLRAEPCRLRPLLDDAARSCQALAADRHASLRFEVERDDLVLPLHASRMHQVFRNLFENALQHSPSGGEVLVRCRTEDRASQAWTVVTVEDSGPGFDQETLARAFEPFFTRRRGGTGLGLSIVRRVVDEHGGTVDAANRAPGGAVLTLRLPMPRARAEAREGTRG